MSGPVRKQDPNRAFSSQPPAFNIHLVGTAAFSKIVVVKDNQYVYSQEPKTADIKPTWRDMSPQPGKKS